GRLAVAEGGARGVTPLTTCTPARARIPPDRVDPLPSLAGQVGLAPPASRLSPVVVPPVRRRTVRCRREQTRCPEPVNATCAPSALSARDGRPSREVDGRRYRGGCCGGRCCSACSGSCWVPAPSPWPTR